jgi:formyl-CoA transferase
VWSKTRKQLIEILDTHGVPVSPINNIKDIFEDEHFRQRENIIEVSHPPKIRENENSGCST